MESENKNKNLEKNNSKLPEDWRWVRLGEVCNYDSGIWGDEPDGSSKCYPV